MALSGKKRWLLQATCGLVLTAAGLSLAIDAGFAKFNGQPWVAYGAQALIIFNSGLCMVIDAARFRKP